jgi:hypothetical protein
MSTEQVQLERRGAQRFDFHLPVTIRLSGSVEEGCGFTQDLSARGALLYTDFPVALGDTVELTLVMPSEITLAENMRVRCRGKVVRNMNPGLGSKPAIAVHLEGYEFLPDVEGSSSADSYRRISALHPDESDAKLTDRETLNS